MRRQNSTNTLLHGRRGSNTNMNTDDQRHRMVQDQLVTRDIIDGSVLDAMGYDPVSVDVLVGRTGLTAEELSSMLLILELQNLVSPVAGGFYSRVA